MIKLTALKRLRYPRGPGGKEYNVGDAFEALSERDAKALTLVRAARHVLSKTATKAPPPAPVVERKDERAAEEPTANTPRRSARYNRSDLQAED